MKQFLLLALLAAALGAQAQQITTIAGTGTAGFSGDGGAATAAQLNAPFGMDADIIGNIYFADRLNNRIRKIDPWGTITTIAGTGVAGYNGGYMPTTTAQLNDPVCVLTQAYDFLIFVSDRGNNRIRLIDQVNSIITSFVGTGTAGYSGDNGPATAATLSQPRGLAADTFSNLYIADQGNNVIRKVAINTGIITTIAGNGTQGFSGDGGPATAAMLNGPYSVDVDYSGNVYIADVDNQRIRKVDPAGIITTIAGTGATTYNGDDIPATTANLNEPICVQVDFQGNVYIADAWHSRIRKINTTGIITTIVGNGTAGYSGDNGPAVDCQLNNPYGMALDNTFAIGTSQSNLIISDYTNNRIRYINTGAVGIANEATAPVINIYPNPSADGRFILNITSSVNEEVKIVITNLLGQQIYSATAITNYPNTIHLTAPSGVYIATITGKHGVITQRIVVDK